MCTGAGSGAACKDNTQSERLATQLEDGTTLAVSLILPWMVLNDAPEYCNPL